MVLTLLGGFTPLALQIALSGSGCGVYLGLFLDYSLSPLTWSYLKQKNSILGATSNFFLSLGALAGPFPTLVHQPASFLQIFPCSPPRTRPIYSHQLSLCGPCPAWPTPGMVLECGPWSLSHGSSVSARPLPARFPVQESGPIYSPLQLPQMRTKCQFLRFKISGNAAKLYRVRKKCCGPEEMLFPSYGRGEWFFNKGMMRNNLSITYFFSVPYKHG